MKELAPKPNQLFVVWAGDLPLEYLMLPLQSRSLPPDFKTLDLDWTYGFSKRRMQQFSVTDLTSIVRRGDGTFFVCRKDQMGLMSAYVRAHFGVDLKSSRANHHAFHDNIICKCRSPVRRRALSGGRHVGLRASMEWLLAIGRRRTACRQQLVAQAYL